MLVVARFWLPNIVPPGRAEVVTSSRNMGNGKRASVGFLAKTPAASAVGSIVNPNFFAVTKRGAEPFFKRLLDTIWSIHDGLPQQVERPLFLRAAGFFDEFFESR